MALPRIEVDGPYYEIIIYDGLSDEVINSIWHLSCVSDISRATLSTTVLVFGDPDAALDQITDIILQGEE